MFSLSAEIEGIFLAFCSASSKLNSKMPFIPVHFTCKVLIPVTVQHPPLPGIPEGSQPGSKCRVLNRKWVYRYRILLFSCKQAQGDLSLKAD